MPTSVYIYTNCMHDLLLVVLQDETFIYYLSESLTCLKFILWKLNICLLKGYLVQNSSSFVFVYLISSIKSDLFWVKNTFVFKEIFVANLIFLHFHSLWFFFYKKFHYSMCFDFLFENWWHTIACVIASNHTPTIDLGDHKPYL